MAAKSDAITELAEKLLRAVEAQRILGANAYPTTLRRLVELADPTSETQTLQKALKKKAFKGRTVVIQAKNLDSPVALVEDKDQLAASAVLLEYLLQLHCKAAKPTIAIGSFKKKAPKAVKDAFASSLDRRLADKTLPPGVALVTIKNKPHLHLQRFPLPRKPEEVLAEELVKVLQAQRRLGEDAYPLSLARLIELTRPEADRALITRVMKHPIFKSAVVLAITSEPETPVALVEDLQFLVDSPQLLIMALRKARTDTDQVRSPKDLKAKVVAPLKEAFEKSIIRRAAEGRLPTGIGRLLKKKEPLLFLLSDVMCDSTQQSKRTTDNGEGNPMSIRPEPPPASGSAGEPDAAFDRAFDEAFQRLEKQARSHNFVSLFDLRRSLPAFDKETFNARLHELRRAGRYTLSAAEGGDGLRPEEQNAGIIEDRALLLYVSRKIS